MLMIIYMNIVLDETICLTYGRVVMFRNYIRECVCVCVSAQCEINVILIEVLFSTHLAYSLYTEKNIIFQWQVLNLFTVEGEDREDLPRRQSSFIVHFEAKQRRSLSSSSLIKSTILMEFN